jgi:monofunctional glycosyltransferase
MLRLIAKAVIWFVGVSLGLTLLFRFVPPPVTVTMLVDANGITKDWTPLSRIDRNMVAAVIAAEDGKFCTHKGFDTDAIEQAMERNAKGGRIRGGSPSASRPPRTCSCGKATAGPVTSARAWRSGTPS